MMELEEALGRILAALPAPETEAVPLSEGHGRVLARKVISSIALPPFDNSAMDGYAVRAEDVKNASASTPVTLSLIGRVAAGESFGGEVASGTCVRIFTGSPLPRGADAVIMQEDTAIEPDQPKSVRCLDGAKPWENIRFRGEDIKEGSTLGDAGDLLSAGRIALLSAAGVSEIWAGRRPTVGLLATGSELVEAGQSLTAGKIFESNRAMLAALANRAGAVTHNFPLVHDTREATGAALEKAFAACDIVVTSGGVSVGEMDFVKSAFEGMGGKLDFWKVAIRPGKPFVFGRFGSKFLFGLPGNPVSAFITFLVLVRPALMHWQGASKTALPAMQATLADPLSNPGTRRHFMRVIVDGEGQARSAGVQNSHVLSSLAEANGIVDLPPQTAWPVGAKVRVMRWE